MAVAAAAALCNIVPKLREFVSSWEEYNLQRDVRASIMFLLHELESLREACEKFSESEGQADELAKLLSRYATDLCSSLDGLVTLVQLRTAVTPGGWKGFVVMTNINSKLKTKKAQRRFARDIDDIKRQLVEMQERHARYTVPPTKLRGLSAPNVADSADGSEDTTTVAAKMVAQLVDAGDVYKFPREVKEVICFLRREFEYMLVVLRIIAMVPTEELDEGTKAWAEDMKDVSCDVKDAVDYFNSRKARGKFAAGVWDLKQQILEVGERRRRYAIPRRQWDNSSDDSPSERVGPRHPDLTSSGSLVAIDRPRDVIVKLLTDEGSTSSQQQLKMASIVGLAGVGKTTLAKAVYRSIAPQFQLKAWVSLSSHPDMRIILVDLLRQLRHQEEQIDQQDQHDKIEMFDERTLIDGIRSSLMDKRYLVVIDDIWDSHALEIVRLAFIENGLGSAVLTTTRKFDVAQLSGRVYRLHPLSETDSKKLFYERFFGCEEQCPSELAEVSTKLIAKCCGIPLTLVATVGLLLMKPQTIESWHEVYSSRYEREGGFCNLRRILDLSYADLPRHLKLCLLYLSMFQKGYQINAESLVWGWIAEGFIQGDETISPPEVGKMYLNELINRNLIESVEIDADCKAYRVYDLVHDLMVSLSTEENFATILNGWRWRSLPDIIHRLSIHGNSIEGDLPRVPLSRVTTLVVSGDAKLVPALLDLQDLRILDLGGCESLQNVHLKGIEKLVFLKYLVIGGNCFTSIPEEISSLLWLQTLDLRATGLKELPESVVKLTALERLIVNSHTKIPGGIGNMKALQELGDINIGKPDLLKELRNLVNTRVLGISIWSWDESYHEALLGYLRVVSTQLKMQSLSIFTCCSLHFMDKLDTELAPQRLQKLEIGNSAFLSLPSFILSLQHLSSLSIEVYKLSQDIINDLGKLLSLCSLSLTSKHAPDGRFGIRTDGFRQLRDFHFVCNVMTNVFGPEPEAMHGLKKLKLSFHASQTEDINRDFNFGLKDHLCSLEQVIVEIISFDASRQVVDIAEAAIREALSRGRIIPPTVDIRRVLVRYTTESEEVAVPATEQKLQKQPKNITSSTSKIPNGLHV